MLFDGLDEAASDARSALIARLIEHAAERWAKCQFVATTRPVAYSDRATLAGFALARIEEFNDEAVEQFLGLWSRILHPDNPPTADAHWIDLRRALGSNPEIRRMARNPMMLTALAVVHWNERRLPEQRSELYDSVVTWLLRAREDKPGIDELGRLDRLGRLAWWMQSRDGGRLTSVERGDAAEALVPLDSKSARAFLEAEVTDSGILVSRNAEFRFLHLTFQEYLAARWAAGLMDADLYAAVLKHGRLYNPEWREVMLLLAGVLREQGSKKVNALLNAITGTVGVGS